MGIDIDKFPHFKSDVDFTETMVTEQSVFALPASVSRLACQYFSLFINSEKGTSVYDDLLSHVRFLCGCHVVVPISELAFSYETQQVDIYVY